MRRLLLTGIALATLCASPALAQRNGSFDDIYYNGESASDTDEDRPDNSDADRYSSSEDNVRRGNDYGDEDGYYDDSRSGSSYIDFHGRKILALAAPVGNSDSALQADVLVIGFPVKKADVEALQQTFRPQKTIVAGYQKRWVKLELEDSIYRRSRNLHLVWADGAFVMD